MDTLKRILQELARQEEKAAEVNAAIMIMQEYLDNIMAEMLEYLDRLGDVTTTQIGDDLVQGIRELVGEDNER